MKAPIACCLTTATLILVPAASFATPEIGAKHNGYSICEEQALHLYAEGMKNGLDFGRNRIEDGKLLSSGRVIPEPHPCEWRDYLDRQLHPPEPTAPSAPGQIAPAPAPVSVAPAPVGGCPSYMAAEATSPDAVNPTSGAAGCYQILPSTAAAHGCTDVGPSCAAAICATEGPGAWASSGANPCPYVQP